MSVKRERDSDESPPIGDLTAPERMVEIDVEKYRQDMRLLHSQEVSTRSKYERTCTGMLHDMFTALTCMKQDEQKEFFTKALREYNDMKLKYHTDMANLATQKRTVRVSRYPPKKNS